MCDVLQCVLYSMLLSVFDVFSVENSVCCILCCKQCVLYRWSDSPCCKQCVLHSPLKTVCVVFSVAISVCQYILQWVFYSLLLSVYDVLQCALHSLL